MTSKDTIDFYSDARYDGRSLLEIWEQQQPCQDIMTPGSALPDYRSFICGLLVRHAPAGASLISVGSGNGFVEQQLQQAGFDVTASDANPLAVEFARRRPEGLPPAVRAALRTGADLRRGVL
jgi:2-polyprenyl-3-methyl-5-hydroxy-6-metoxy-1,4-benzoquinol methylase